MLRLFRRKEPGKGGRKWRDERQRRAMETRPVWPEIFYPKVEWLPAGSGGPSHPLPGLLCFPQFFPLFWSHTCCSFPEAASLPSEGKDQAPGWGPLGGRSDQEAGGELPACAKHAVEPPCLLLTVKTPLWVPPTAPRAPRLSLGHLVVVAMETTSKMACKSTQAITRGRAAEQWGRAGTLHLPPIRAQWKKGLGRVQAQVKGVPIWTLWEKEDTQEAKALSQVAGRSMQRGRLPRPSLKH